MQDLLLDNAAKVVILILISWIILLYRKNIILKYQLKNEKELRKAQENLEEKFKNISNEVLMRSQDNIQNNILNIAKETFDKTLNLEKVEQNKRQNEFSNLINPIRETLGLFDKKISQIEKDRIDAYSDLRRQVKALMLCQQEIQKETLNLNKALSTPFMSGQWGEMQLRRVVEISGMLAHCDFIEQKQSEFSKLRPDMIIKLPGDRNIIVDAKAPIDAYTNAINSGNEDYLEQHAKRIRAHIKTLSQKAYWEQFSPTPEFVLMFLPGECFFSSAVKKDPTLIEYGVREKVIITTPITLIALLKAIAFSWRQEAIAKNAKLIGEVGKSVFYNLEKLIEYSKNFEKRMHKNIEEYDKISQFIDKNILPSANKLNKLGIEINSQDALLE